MAAQQSATPLEQAKVCALQNGRYHADREAWFEWCHRVLMLGVIVGGSSALLDVWPWLKAASSLSAVFFGAMDLVFNLSGRAKSHAFLRKQYFGVAAKLEYARSNVPRANSEMMLLSADEEPLYYAVHALAENWATRAVLGPNARQPCDVGWFRKHLRHVFRYDQVAFGSSDHTVSSL